VEAGGTLITSTQNPFIGTHTSEEDLLLNDFNIELEPEETDADTRDLLEKLADGFDEESDESDDENSDTEKADDKQDTSLEKPPTEDTEEKTLAEKSSDKKTNKKNGKAKKDEKPENYYRCSMKETPTAIEFADEEKPLNFDFSRRSQFIYYDYIAHDDAKEDTKSGETPTDQDLAVGDAQKTESVAEEETDAEEDYHYDEKREHLLYFDIGEGSVTITSDNTIWANQRIDCHDHAYGLWRLVNPDGRVWFLINQDAPSLASILWRNASYGVIAGMIALVLWLWALSVRFGPALVIEQSGRRSLAEHIYASAMLLWRKQQHPQLLNILRKEILESLDEQHPNLDQASGEQRLEFLHQLTGIAQADIKQALFADGLHHPQEFAAAIAHLQTIRKQLSGSNYD
jgi:hypothetical protein